VSVGEAGKVALWAHQCMREHGRCLLVTYVSLGVRVAIAAREMGLDLTGAMFVGAGEPPTPAKVRAIRSCGASWMSSYGFTEGGMVALSCGNPSGENDLHVWRDAWAVTQNPVRVPGSTLEVDAFSFTSLMASAPKIMLNVELDDYGILDQRDCGCPMQRAGFPDHVRDIFSFRKLTGEGMTLVGSTMLRVLEETLPQRFGGSALDYQLVEEEDDGGFTRLTIVISPQVGDLDEREVIDAALDEIARDSPGADLARAVWRDAGTLRIRREDPTWSTLGKLLSLRPAKRNAGIVFDDSGERVNV
jgi:phenylacetate-coenzyme A ligase PaaK-like adenylate-forming protein